MIDVPPYSLPTSDDGEMDAPSTVPDVIRMSLDNQITRIDSIYWNISFWRVGLVLFSSLCNTIFSSSIQYMHLYL